MPTTLLRHVWVIILEVRVQILPYVSLQCMSRRPRCSGLLSTMFFSLFNNFFRLNEQYGLSRYVSAEKPSTQEYSPISQVIICQNCLDSIYQCIARGEVDKNYLADAQLEIFCGQKEDKLE